jgi:DNA-directed RNA polymerase subunit RPC12/RpoP
MRDYTVAKNVLTGKPLVHYSCEKCGEKLKSNLMMAGQLENCPNCRFQFACPGEKELAEIKAEEEKKKKKSSEDKGTKTKLPKLPISEASEKAVRRPPRETDSESNALIGLPVDEISGHDLGSFENSSKKSYLPSPLYPPKTKENPTQVQSPKLIDQFERWLFAVARSVAYLAILGVFIAIIIFVFFIFSASIPIQIKEVSYEDAKNRAVPPTAPVDVSNSPLDDTNEANSAKQTETRENQVRELFESIFSVAIPKSVAEHIASTDESDRFLITQNLLFERATDLKEKDDVAELVRLFDNFLEQLKADPKMQDVVIKKRVVDQFLNQQYVEIKKANELREANKIARTASWTATFFAFQIFVLCAVVLVLFTIERNTRRGQK